MNLWLSVLRLPPPGSRASRLGQRLLTSSCLAWVFLKGCRQQQDDDIGKSQPLLSLMPPRSALEAAAQASTTRLGSKCLSLEISQTWRSNDERSVRYTVQMD